MFESTSEALPWYLLREQWSRLFRLECEDENVSKDKITSETCLFM